MTAGLRSTPVAVESLQSYLRRLVLCGVAPLVVGMVALIADQAATAHREQGSKLQALALRAVHDVDSNLARRIHGLQTLSAASLGRNAGTLEDLYAHAVAYDKAFGSSVVLSDASKFLFNSRLPFGQPLASYPASAGESPVDKVLKSGAAVVGDLVQGPTFGRSLVTVATPAAWQSGSLVWVVTVRVEQFQQLLQALTIADGWGVTLLDSVGQTVAQHGLKGDAVDAPQSSGRRMTLPIPHAPWTVVAYASVWAFYGPVIWLGVALLVLLGVTIYSALWLSSRSARRLYGEVEGLADFEGRARSSLRLREIEAVHQKLHQLRVAEQQAEQRERERVARELHDGLQQHLANVQITVELARQRADQPPEGAELLQRASRSTEHVIGELHHIVRDLRPPALSQLGLGVALQQLCDGVEAATDLAIELELPRDEAALRAVPEPHADCAYRVTQECLNNVRKHAQATFVHVWVEVTHAQALVLQVSDDGRGIVSGDANNPGSFGLTSMRQRVAAIGGRLTVERGHDGDTDRGTTVRMVCPLGTRPSG